LTMSDSRAAAGMDRLPWLADEPEPKAVRAKTRNRDLTGWAIAAGALLAGTSFWLGTRSQAPEVTQPKSVRTVALARTPQTRPAQGLRIVREPEIRQGPVPEVRQERVPEVRSAPQPMVHLRHELARPAQLEQETAEAPVDTFATTTATGKPAQASPALKPWPPRVNAGAYGRLVQIGAYGSRLQAKRGWVAMVRAYPALQRLPALVVDSRNSHGRHFYRFQIGTTSQAHSEVLCQRMQKLDLSCAIIGLPWKAKVER
jgi:hypothetical protein